MITGCSPLIPDNFLSPSTINSPERVCGHWIKPRLIQITPNMLDTREGQCLLKPILCPQPYKIGPFDSLDIIVWGHPEISTIATSSAALPGGGTAVQTAGSGGNPSPIVQPNGKIFFPYIGYLYVSGLTIEEGQDLIAHRLSLYIRNPQVSVQVSKFRNSNIYVLGEVGLPGMIPITDKPLSLMEAISKAGGIKTTTADPTHIYIIRGCYRRPDIFSFNGQSPQTLMIAEKFPLQENDIVYIPAATLSSFTTLVNTILPTFATYYTIKGLS